MMKSKKVMLGLFTATILSMNTVTAYAANTDVIKPISNANPILKVMPVKAELPGAEGFKFASFAGKVKEIADFKAAEGSKIILVEGKDGNIANLVVSKDTYILNNAEIVVGAEITGYFNANAPMIMIYPAQYNAEVIVVADEKNQSVKVDTFDKDLVSSDGWLKLKISDATEIVSQDGTAFTGELADRKLVVTYNIATTSIPAQTNPIKVVVLAEKETPVIGDVSTMDIIVNNKRVEAPAAFADEKGTVMVPLRAIGEALGYEVAWNNEDQSIMLGKGISLTIGKDSYHFAKMAPIQLSDAPIIKDGKTFVPLNFFKEVVRMNNAHVFEGQIVIDNGEKME